MTNATFGRGFAVADVGWNILYPSKNIFCSREQVAQYSGLVFFSTGRKDVSYGCEVLFGGCTAPCVHN